MHKLLSGLFIVLILITPREAHAGREIPDDNLAYPVLIEFEVEDDCCGSGFFLKTDTNQYLVTARHVLFNKDTGNLKGEKATLLSYSKDLEEEKRNILELDLPTLLASNRIRKHLTEDIAVICISDVSERKENGETTLRLAPGVTFKERAPLGTVSVTSHGVKRYDDVLIGNNIYVFGYPRSIGMKGIPQIDPLRPLLRFGIVAGKNPTQKTIILDCPLYGGNSGGPVLEVEEVSLSKRSFRVVGVVTQLVPVAEKLGKQDARYTNSGYGVAVSMDSVFELIDLP